jgi:hypothetical protein
LDGLDLIFEKCLDIVALVKILFPVEHPIFPNLSGQKVGDERARIDPMGFPGDNNDFAPSIMTPYGFHGSNGRS